MLTRLEKVLYRLEAQHVCFAWAFSQIEHQSGVVFEIGLGLGRTFNHMRHHMPEREIIVFERKVNAYPDCMPKVDELIIGEVAETLPAMAQKYAGQVVLAHSDIGSFDKEMNKEMSELMSANLLPCLAPGGIIMSDLPLSVPETEELPLPEGARPGRYYLYRRVA
jgi:hypothetical protein